MTRFLFTVALTSFITSSVFGGMVAEFIPVTSESSATPPPGYLTFDLQVTTTTDWLAANLVLDLAQGSIYQNALLVGIGPPSAALISAIPSLRWDTYVTGSGGIAGGAPSSAGGAVDIGGTSAGSFNEDRIDLNWFTVSTNDVGLFTIGRFTLSEDASGYYELRVDALGQDAPLVFSGIIENGSFVAVPEANVVLLSGIGMLAAAFHAWRRRRLGRLACE